MMGEGEQNTLRASITEGISSLIDYEIKIRDANGLLVVDVFPKNGKELENAPTSKLTPFLFFKNLHKWKLRTFGISIDRVEMLAEYEDDYLQLNFYNKPHDDIFIPVDSGGESE